MRFIPSLPRMTSAEYWHALAMPNSNVHSTPLAVTEIGSSICANDSA